MGHLDTRTEAINGIVVPGAVLPPSARATAVPVPVTLAARVEAVLLMAEVTAVAVAESSTLVVRGAARATLCVPFDQPTRR